MARGLLSGFLVGATVSVCVVAVASFVAGPPAPPDFRTDVGAEGVAPPISAELSGPLPARGEAEAPPPEPPMVDVPDRDRQATIDLDAIRPAERPEAVEPAARVEKPSPMGQTGGLTVEEDTPVAAEREATRPSAPEGDQPTTTPFDRPNPPGSEISPSDPGPGGAAGLAMPDAMSAESPLVPTPEPEPRRPADTPSAPGAPGRKDSPAVFEETVPRPDTGGGGPAETRETTDASAAPVVPVRDEEARGPDATDRATAPGLAEASEREAAPSAEDFPRPADRAERAAGGGPEPGIAVLPQAGLTGSAPERSAPAIGRPATSLLQRPADQDASDPTPEQADEGLADAIDTDAEQPAIVRHAEPFDAAEGEPLLSIILMDTGQDLEESPVGLAALGSFPYALSFAVDTSLPDAEERAESYRAAGYEVLAMVDLPANLTASDTEVALAASLARVPQAVGVLEGPGSGLRGSPEMAAQVTAILEESGHGIVWRPGGLDTAQRLAARSGVASHTLYRDFDSEEQTPLVIRRFLDFAALRATQEDSIVMVGRMRPDTLSALLVWGLQDRAQRVVVAPISTTLLADRQGS